MNIVIKKAKECIVFAFHRIGIDLCVTRVNEKLKEDGKILINLGSGDWECKGWFNLDISTKWYSKSHKGHRFIEYNIRKDDIPFDDGKVDCIYCSHVIEHIEDDYDMKMLKECYRVLNSGGVFRIACPDAEYLWSITKEGKEWWSWRKKWCKTFGVDWEACRPIDLLVRELATPRMKGFGYLYGKEQEYLDYDEKYKQLPMEEFLLYITNGLQFNEEHVGDHINYWTYDKLRKMLADAGFKTIIRSRYGSSVSPMMRSKAYFDKTEPHMSLYVDAIKD